MNEIGNGKNFPPLEPDLKFRVTSWLLIASLVVPGMQIFMKVFNRTRMIGKDKLSRLNGKWILMSNHVTLLDDLFLGPIIFFPKSLRSYSTIPYHAPEERNFYKVPIIAWFMRQVKSIPVIRGKGINQEGANLLIKAVKAGGLLHIYPEGTRTRSGEIGPAKAGIGRIVYESEAIVVPMYHYGLEKVLPIGAGVPRIGKKLYVSIGDPIGFEDERKMPNNVETWRLISDKIMDGIRKERNHLQQVYGLKFDQKTSSQSEAKPIRRRRKIASQVEEV